MRKIFTLSAALLMAAAACAQELSVTLETAGTLSTLVPEADKYSTTKLTVSGPVNGTDLAFIRDMAGKDIEGESTTGTLVDIDLSAANIVAGGVYYSDLSEELDYESVANTIGAFLFSNLNIKSVALPATVTTVGERAFYNSNKLVTVTNFDKAVYLGTEIFYNCKKLENVAVNATITHLPDALFRSCKKLSSITISPAVKVIGEKTFAGVGITELTLPEGLDSIMASAFDGVGITELALPSTVTYVGDNAFTSCKSLTDLSLNDGLKEIGEGAFSWCTSLTKAVIPESVEHYGESIFSVDEALEEVILPENIPFIPNGMFDRCSALSTINIPDGVTEIGEMAFQNCEALPDFDFPTSLNTICKNAFSGCTGFTAIVLPEGVTTVDANAFQDCSNVTYLQLNSDLQSIGACAFQGLGITSLTIPEGITDLTGPSTGLMSPSGMIFAGCDNLEYLHLPSTLTALGRATFAYYGYDDYGPLSEIIVDAVTPPTIGESDEPFEYVNYETCKVTVPAGTLEAYKAATGWQNFTLIAEAEEEEEEEDIIIKQPKGTLTDNLYGYHQGYYDLGWQIYAQGNDGNVNAMVINDKGNVYLKDPVSGMETDGWLKGYFNEAKDSVIFDLPQAIDLDEETGDTLYISKLVYTPEQSEWGEEAWFEAATEDNRIVFAYKDGQFIYGEEDNYKHDLIGVITADGQWKGYGDSYKLIMPQTDPRNTPSATAEDPKQYVMTHVTSDSDENNITVERVLVKLIKDGNDIYLTDLTLADDSLYVKLEGTDGQYAVKGYQYAGINTDLHFYAAPLGWKRTYNEFWGQYSDSTYVIDQMNFAYDAATDTYTGDNVYLGVKVGKLHPTTPFAFKKPVLSPYTEVLAAPAMPTAVECQDWVNEYGNGYFFFYLTDTDADGNYLDTKRLYYNIFFDTDDEPYTFTREIYEELEDDTADIPYSYVDDAMNFLVNGTLHQLTFYEGGHKRIGVREFYLGSDGNKYYSDIAWIDIVTEGIDTANAADKKVSKVVCYDLNGRQVLTPQRGVVIQKSTFEDGTVKVQKIIR